MIKKLLARGTYLNAHTTIGKGYDVCDGHFNDDNGTYISAHHYQWGMPDTIKIAVSDGSDKDCEPHNTQQHQYCKHRTNTVCYLNYDACDGCVEKPLEQKPSPHATNGGYPEDEASRLMPMDTGETMLKRMTKPKPEDSGGKCNYYTIPVRVEVKGEWIVVDVVCEDVIEALDMRFNDGTAFKSLWRRAAAFLGKEKANNTALRDSQKAVHYSNRMERFDAR